jgi:acyl carrier protein
MVSESKLLTFLAEDLGIDTSEITAASPLFSTGVIDSFALVSLMTYLEDEGGFRLSPVDVNLDNLDSVDRIVAFCRRKSSP